MTGRNKTYKSAAYKEYQNEIWDELKTHGDLTWPFGSEQVCFDVEAGLSNRGQDLDNVIKPVLDTYQTIYADFNDNKVYKITLTKSIVKKGEEYLDVTVHTNELPEM